MKKVIYVCGDSFTAGEDLGDWMIPGNLTWTLEERATKFDYSVYGFWWRDRDKILNEKKLHNEFNEYNETHRWSSVLEFATGIPVINKGSEGGQSLYAIGYKTIHDVLKLQAEGYDIDQVIIQLTSCDRHALFTHVDEYRPLSPAGKDYLIKSFVGDPRANNSFLTESYREAQPYNMTLYRYIVDLFFLDNTLTRILGKPPIFVDSIFLKNESLSKVLNRTTIREIIENKFFVFEDQLVSGELCDYGLDIVNNRIELAMDDDIPLDARVWTTSFHLDETIHKNFAHRIAERYFND